MAAKIVSVRIDRELLSQLERVARDEQRSVSGQIVHSIRASLSAYARVAKAERTMGMFRGRKVPARSELRRLRAELSAKLPRKAL